MKKVLLAILTLTLFACGGTQKSEGPQYYRQVQQNHKIEYESPAPPSDVRIMVYNAYQTLKVKSLEGIGGKISAIAKSMDGYLLESSEIRMQFRVPKDSLEAALQATAKLGEVAHQEIRGADVTEQHNDLALRLDNAQQSRQRYLQLLEKAESVGDILLIEKELERLQYTIESLQGQLNKLDETIAYSTITVTLQEKVRPGPLGWVFVGLYEAVKFLFVWD